MEIYKAVKGFGFMRFYLFGYCKVYKMRSWIPAYAGMTKGDWVALFTRE
jgi:hypothetical protein